MAKIFYWLTILILKSNQIILFYHWELICTFIWMYFILVFKMKFFRYLRFSNIIVYKLNFLISTLNFIHIKLEVLLRDNILIDILLTNSVMLIFLIQSVTFNIFMLKFLFIFYFNLETFCNSWITTHNRRCSSEILSLTSFFRGQSLIELQILHSIVLIIFYAV